MLKFFIVFISIVAVLVLSAAIASQIANYRFNRLVDQEVRAFLGQAKGSHEIIQKDDLNGLPTSVQKWLEYSQVIGKERIVTVRTKQKALMRMKEKQSWIPLEAEQYFTTDKPGFIWRAKIQAAPLIHVVGRDKYQDGQGNMLIKVLSLFSVADGKGKEIDQGSLVRFLAEIVWVPTAALMDYIQWDEIDDRSAKATITYKGVTAWGIFTFNEKGEVTNFLADRYGDFNGRYALEKWSILMEDYHDYDGFRIPTKGEVVWKLKTGDFKWYQFQVIQMEYNEPVMY